MMRTASILFGVLLGACTSPSPGTVSPLNLEAGVDTAPQPICNGHTELCGRAYTAVAFPGTHDADATIVDQFAAADQTGSVAQQLEDGIRVLHFEMQPYQGDTYLCHAQCVLGAVPLLTDLQAVETFVVAHPNDVVTLLLESENTTSDAIAKIVEASGLLPYLHTQVSGAPWPTLGEMIHSGDHVVVFNADLTNTGGARFPWLNDRFATTWETPWNNVTPQDFARCDADRGTKGNDLYVVDIYREDTPIASVASAASVNTNPFLIDRVKTCQKTEATFPNFVMVNFYEVGDVFRDVDVLNGLAPDPGEDVGSFPPAMFPMVDAGP